MDSILIELHPAFPRLTVEAIAWAAKHSCETTNLGLHFAILRMPSGIAFGVSSPVSWDNVVLRPEFGAESWDPSDVVRPTYHRNVIAATAGDFWGGETTANGCSGTVMAGGLRDFEGRLLAALREASRYPAPLLDLEAELRQAPAFIN